MGSEPTTSCHDASKILQASTIVTSLLGESMIAAVLLTVTFGMFTVLTAVAAYVLFWKGIKKETVVMLAAIIIMWASTLVYWINALWRAKKIYFVLLSYLSTEPDKYSGADFDEIVVAFFGGGCVGNAVMTVNVTIGDAIVWWRAWVLWANNRVVQSICIVMLSFTAVTAALNARSSCILHRIIEGIDGPIKIAFAGDNVWGVIGVSTSLLTNLVATLLIAYRTWKHRRLIISCLRASSRRTQVERTLALLVESGLLYCAFWAAIVTFSSSEYILTGEPGGRVSKSTFEFTSGFAFVLLGCGPPFVGMYPTLIIILCAASKSLNEKSAEEASTWNSSIILYAPRISHTGTLSQLSRPGACTSDDPGGRLEGGPKLHGGVVCETYG